MVNRILGIAIPSSFEGGVFQVAKVILGSITAMFGTSQIAANGIAQSFWSMAALVGIAMGTAYITVIGQTVGAKDYEVSDYYMMKLTRISYVGAIVWNGLLLLVIPIILQAYNLTSETRQLVIILVVIHNVFSATVQPFAMPFANGLRAAGDVRFTVIIAMISTVFGRVVLSLVFAIGLNMGVIGIALAMVTDWCIRAVLYYSRYRSERWKDFELI